MKTPRYEFYSDILKKNYINIQSALKYCQICYAVKANGNPLVLKVLNDLGSSFECDSKYEYDNVINIGGSEDKIIFGLPIKTTELIRYVYDRGCRYFVFEDMKELAKLETNAPEAKKILRIGILDIDPSTIPFGMSYEEILKNSESNNLFQRLDGISFSISCNNNIELVEKVIGRIKKIFNMLDSCHKKYILNVGGGYKIDTKNEFYERYREILLEMKNKYGCCLLAEPGQAIVGSAGSFIARVISKKKTDDGIKVYIDGGYPNGFGYSTFLGKVKVINKKRCIDNQQNYKFIDCTNLNQPILSESMNVEIKVGDILEFTNSGAYSLVFQNDFHMWDKSEVVMLQNSVN